MGFSPKDLYNGIFPLVPYELPLTQEFLLSVRVSNYPKTKHLFSRNKYLVYQFDSVSYFAFSIYKLEWLHWSALVSKAE